MYGRYPIESRSSDADLLFGRAQYREMQRPKGIVSAVMFAIGVLIGLLVF